MQQLMDSLKVQEKQDEVAYEATPFSESAASWAAHCVRVYKGDLLDRALGIAKAMAHFEDGLLHPDTLKD